MIRESTIILIVISFGLIPLSCGEPNDWQSNGWVLVADTETALSGRPSALSADGGVVYYLCRAGSQANVIFKYAVGGITNDFSAPADVSLADISVRGDYGWAVGQSEGRGAYLARLTGGRWQTIIDGHSLYSDFLHVESIGYDRCWITAHKKSGGSTTLIKYSGGSLTEYAEAGAPDYLATSGKGEVFAYSIKGRLINASFNGGADWGAEEVKIDTPGLEITGVIATSAAGQTLYLAVRLKNAGAGDENWGIVKRTGPPGNGRYNLSFYSFQGPHFTSIESITFANENEGMAGGSFTSAIYKSGEWLLEKTTPGSYYLIDYDPAGCYWAFFDGNDSSPVRLMQHH